MPESSPTSCKQKFRWRTVSLRLLAVLVVVVLLLTLAGWLHTNTQATTTWQIPTQQLVLQQIPRGEQPRAIARGRYLTHAVLGCTACHGNDLAGAVFQDISGIARIAGPNLTPAGVTNGYQSQDWVRAIRHGVGRDGQPLAFMGGGILTDCDASDLTSVVLYLQTLEPNTNEVPPAKVRWLGGILALFGALEIYPATTVDHRYLPPTWRPADNIVAEKGRYLARIAGCDDCHRANLAGGHFPGTPPNFPVPSNLTVLHDWREQDFADAVRLGKSRDGRILDTFMPWPVYAQMTDEDIHALWVFVQGSPAAELGSAEFGARDRP